jgi:PIN domain nuclease of toxin-antitoxin system
MNKYVIDAWAWIEYFKGTTAGLDVKKRTQGGEINTNVVTLSEVISKFQRDGLDTNEAFEAVTSMSKMIPINEQFAKEVGLLHANTKKSRPNFSLADAFALYTARRLHAKVLTGDPGFKGLKEAIMLK